MPKDLTFTEVCSFIKSDDGKLIEAADNLLGAAIICSPAIFGPAALPALSLLGAKNGLTALGRNLLSKITSKKESDYLARMQRMEVAYGLICYTAFFDAIDQNFSEDLLKEISLQLTDKLHIAAKNQKCTAHDGKTKQLAIEPEGPFVDPLPFPHPTSSFNEITKHLSNLYDQMAKSFDGFIENSSILEDEKKAAVYSASLKTLPKTAIKCFEAQYFELARKYDEFRIWIQINDRKEMSNYFSKYQALADNANSQIDIGFNNLQKTVLAIPDRFREVNAINVVEGLKRSYSARIEEPVIDDKEISAGKQLTLTFPKISKAFIPQSYRVLRQMSKDVHLEKEETWERLEQKHNLSAFIASFLSSPFSIETPLLILGHPGGGKSLLTKVLSAKLMSHAYTPIRIPLREVNADLSIEALVEKQIERDAGCRISSWADFASQFQDRPLLIILDGFDELLQASGTVFAGFLDKLQKFQQDQIIHKHPARVIVTSRITLIDKATVPMGATVLRLLEFNEEQRNAWIAIWNKVNIRYFKSQTPKVKLFSLPKKKKGVKKDKILELAEQPLLLLMLALYDSENNSLHKTTQLDRTVLYDSLLRRFVQRERRRYVDGFDHLPHSEQTREIDNEMKRLGVAAIGMYNRRQLHVLSSELSSDLEFFGVGRKHNVTNGRPLTEADLLLGSFFFIHQSSTGDDEEEHSINDTAFEFLHNTFGEFLTADFILRFTLQEAEALYTLKQNDSLSSELQRKLHDPNGLAKEWFVCLMHSPFYLRPVIPEMIREWSAHIFQKKKFSREKFLECFDELLKSQVKMVLGSKAFPDIMRTESAAQFADIPFLGLIATYTLNLMILRTIVDKNKFVFNEIEYGSENDEPDSEDRGTRPWDKLTQIWRSWFRIENLSGLSAIMTATRDGEKVILKGRDEFRARPSGNQLNTVINVAAALGDNITMGLAGLHTRESSVKGSLSLDELDALLKQENIDLSFEFLIRHLRTSLLRPFLSQANFRGHDGNELITKGLELVLRFQQSSNLVIAFIDLVGKAMRRGSISLRCRHEVQSEFLHPRHIMEIMERYPEEVTIEWIRLIHDFGSRLHDRYDEEFFKRTMHPKDMMRMRPEVAFEWMLMMWKVGGSRWIERYGEEFFERAMHPKKMMPMMEMRPEVAIELIRMMREFGGNRWIERYGEEFFKRTMHPKEMMRMMEMRPEVAIEWIRMMREFGGNRWIERYGEEFFERTMHPKEMMRMMEMRPEVAIELMRLVQKSDKRHWINHLYEFIQYEIQPDHVVALFAKSQDAALTIIKVLHLCGDEHLVQHLHGEHQETQVSPALRRRFDVTKIPLDYIADLQWYARVTGNNELQREIDYYTSWSSGDI